MGQFPELKDSNDVQVSICHKGKIDPTQAHAWLTSPAIILKFEQGESPNYQRVPATRQPRHPILIGEGGQPIA